MNILVKSNKEMENNMSHVKSWSQIKDEHFGKKERQDVTI